MPKTEGEPFDPTKKKNEKKKTTFKAVVLCVICRQTSCQILLSPPRTMVFLDSFLFTTPPCAWNSDVLPFLGVVDYIKSSNNFKQQSLLTGLVLLERTLQQPSAFPIKNTNNKTNKKQPTQPNQTFQGKKTTNMLRKGPKDVCCCGTLDNHMTFSVSIWDLPGTISCSW